MRYKVLKDFLDNDSYKCYKKDDVYEIIGVSEQTKALLENGFIKETKQCGLNGQYIPP